ncbi:MAG: TraR/DksA family transcriptional regulator [Gammaproteobacteria bacterium]|nr:TraR/DksA family transcriptional regulator [Gammaproteobacteria bacterium]MBT8443310.1 TraR/DksA family transcriptional regulator [Gammaproteobacteria bacterium]NND37766.1 TraR/DksA family transcriptional regulator [Gammaproteobacteria bacterium]
MSTDTQQVREKLLAFKAELQKRIDRIHNHARDPLNADSAEQAAELGNVQVVSAIEAEAMQELTDIENALHRLTAGNYGVCISCGEDISPKRLDARPACAECVDCAELSVRR